MTRGRFLKPFLELKALLEPDILDQNVLKFISWWILSIWKPFLKYISRLKHPEAHFLNDLGTSKARDYLVTRLFNITRFWSLQSELTKKRPEN